jgi:IS5 family transposase
MNTTITPMKAFLNAATTDERETLAKRCNTSAQYLGHLAVNDDRSYKREPKIALAAAIERETKAMSKASKGRLPVVLRTDLIEGCRQCAYAQKCLGDRALAGEFPIVTGEQMKLFD